MIAAVIAGGSETHERTQRPTFFLLENGSGPLGLRLEWPKIDPDYGGAEITLYCTVNELR
jgi:hypothetical protein